MIMENLEENDKIFGHGSFPPSASSPHLVHILLKNILAPFGCMQRWYLWVTDCIWQIQSLAIETENDFAFLNMAAFVNGDQTKKLQVTTHYLQSQDTSCQATTLSWYYRSSIAYTYVSYIFRV